MLLSIPEVAFLMRDLIDDKVLPCAAGNSSWYKAGSSHALFEVLHEFVVKRGACILISHCPYVAAVFTKPLQDLTQCKVLDSHYVTDVRGCHVT